MNNAEVKGLSSRIAAPLSHRWIRPNIISENYFTESPRLNCTPSTLYKSKAHIKSGTSQPNGKNALQDANYPAGRFEFRMHQQKH